MDENTLISLAIAKEQRGRWRELLKDSKRRSRVLGALNHTPPLDTRYTKWHKFFAVVVRSMDIDDERKVYVISAANEIDGKTMTFAEAIDAVPRYGWGSLIGVSKTLAIYYGELGEQAAVIRKVGGS